MKTVAITAGASTPTPIVKEVINYIKDYDPAEEILPESKVPMTKILPKIKNPTPSKIME